MGRYALAGLVASLSLSLAPAPAPAIVGGSPASDGEYPWMAAIYTGSPSGGQYCGGSLVRPALVLTAAHCINDLLDNTLASLPLDVFGLKVKVLVGRTQLDGSGGETITAMRLHVHPNFDASTLSHDFAVLELQRASVYTPIDYLRPGQGSAYAPGTTATITGWGATSEGGNGSNQLLDANVPIVSDTSCSSSYPGAIVAATMVCAGYPDGGVDTCQGDSGGPLMVPRPDGGLVLAGVTSWGEGCARPNRPGVYAEVPAAAAFIDQHS